MDEAVCVLGRADNPAEATDDVAGGVEQIAERFPEVRLVRNHRNGGFPANNLVMGDLDGVRYLGLVNNDALQASA